MPRSGKLSVLNSLTGQKSCFSPRMGDSVQRYTSNLAGATGTWVRLAVQNFTSIATLYEKLCVGSKNESTPFLLASTSSITMQSLGKIVQRAPAVGAKMWCLLPAGCREAANCRYSIYSQAKYQVFAPQGDSLHRFRSNLAGPTGTRYIYAWLYKILPQSGQVVGMRPPKYQKFPLFGKVSSLDRFRKF